MNKKKYDFLREIALNAYYRSVDGEKSIGKKRSRETRTPLERPEREETIETCEKYTRM